MLESIEQNRIGSKNNVQVPDRRRIVNEVNPVRKLAGIDNGRDRNAAFPNGLVSIPGHAMEECKFDTTREQVIRCREDCRAE